jgi:hypothetical protein
MYSTLVKKRTKIFNEKNRKSTHRTGEGQTEKK